MEVQTQTQNMTTKVYENETNQMMSNKQFLYIESLALNVIFEIESFDGGTIYEYNIDSIWNEMGNEIKTGSNVELENKILDFIKQTWNY